MATDGHADAYCDAHQHLDPHPYGIGNLDADGISHAHGDTNQHGNGYADRHGDAHADDRAAHAHGNG